MAESIPEMKLVAIRIFSGITGRAEAELAKSLLEAEGIACVLSGDIAAVTIPVFNVPLLVREEDAERALEILERYEQPPGPMLVE